MYLVVFVANNGFDCETCRECVIVFMSVFVKNTKGLLMSVARNNNNDK